MTGGGDNPRLFFKFLAMLGKTANAAYREYKISGGTLGFSDFIHREKEKSFNADGNDNNLLLINKSLNEGVHKTINNVVKEGGLKDRESGKTVFGVHKGIVIGSAVVITGAIIFFIVKRYNS